MSRPSSPPRAPSSESSPPSDLPPSSAEPTPEPPPLPYSISEHKIPILIIWTLLALDSVILPIVLFYPLWYTRPSTGLRPAIIFAVTTSVFGFISGLEWAYRSWQLMTKPHVRPLGVEGPPGIKKGMVWKGLFRKKRYHWGFDFFHWSYTTGYIIALAELIVGAAPHHPIVRLCAAPSPSFITIFGSLICIITTYHHLHLPAPFRISSEPAGSRVRPATYTILGDVMSVDTGVGKRYRKALQLRYEKSRRFRQLLRQLDLFWGIPALMLGVGLLASIGHHGVEQALVYGLGWGLPPIWAMVWACITTAWVKISLRREKIVWRREYEKSRGEEKTVMQEGSGVEGGMRREV